MAGWLDCLMVNVMLTIKQSNHSIIQPSSVPQNTNDMLLQTMETATSSFWGNSAMFWLLWLGTFLLATALYWFGYGKRYKDQVEDKESTIKKMRPQLNLLSNEKEHLTTEKTSLKENLSEIVNKHNSLKSYHDSVQAKYLAVTKQFDQANEERQSLLESYESLEKNLEATEQRYNDSLTKIDQLELQLENLDIPLVATGNSSTNEKALSSEIAALEASLTNKEEEIKKLNLLLAAQPKIIEKKIDTSNLEQKNKQLYKDKEQLQTVYTALQLDYNQLRNAHTTLTNQFQDLQGKQQQLSLSSNSTTENKTLKTQLLVLEKKHKDLMVQKEHIQSKLNQQDQAISALQSTNQSLQDKLGILSGQHQKALAHAKSLQSSIFSAEKEQAEKKGALNQVERMLKEIQTENNQLKEQNIGLNLSQKQLQSQQVNLLREVTALRPQAKDSQSIHAIYQLEIQQLKQKIQSQGEELVKATSQQNVFSDLKSTNLALDTQNKNLNTAYLNLQKKYDGFHKDHLTLKSQFQLLRDKYEHLENTSNNIREQKGKLEKANNSLSDELNQLKQNQRALEIAKTNSEKRVKEIEKYLATPQKKTSSATQTTKLYKNGSSVQSVPPDDLKVIEGISTSMERLLNNAGIFTWKKLSKSGIGELRRLIIANGTSLNETDPTTWPEQAELAVANQWEQLEAFQKELINGKRIR